MKNVATSHYITASEFRNLFNSQKLPLNILEATLKSESTDRNSTVSKTWRGTKRPSLFGHAHRRIVRLMQLMFAKSHSQV